MRKSDAWALLLSVAAVAMGCGGGTEPSDSVVVLRHQPHGLLAGYSLDTLAETIAVRAIRITEDGEVPAAGLEIGWSVSDAELGAIIPAVSVTDSGGYASARWVLGIGSGTQRATARTLNGEGMAHFDAMSLPGLTAAILMKSNYSRHTCAIDTEGSTWCWGYDGGGQLGDRLSIYGSSRGVVDRPVRVLGTQRFVELTGTQGISCGLTELGELFCWGTGKSWTYFISGWQPGIPFRFAPDISFKSISASVHPICGVTPAGAGYCWGEGWIGDGSEDKVDALEPVRIGESLTWSEINVASWEDFFATTTDLEVYAWGRAFPDNRVHYGVEHAGNLTVPIPTPLVSGVSGIASTFHGRCGLAGGAAICWGDLGNYFADPPGPWTVTAPGGQFTQLTAGADHVWGLTSAGEIYMFGGSVPMTRLNGRGPWSTIATGPYLGEGVCGILATDGGVYCWDFRSQPDVGMVIPRAVPAPDVP